MALPFRPILFAASVALASTSAGLAAITINNTNNPHNLRKALIAPGNPIVVTNATLEAPAPCGAAMTTGIYSLSNNPDTYSLQRGGVVISTGNARDYETGPNTQAGHSFSYQTCSGTNPGLPASAAQEGLLDPITGGTFQHFDATTLTVVFDVPGDLVNPFLSFDLVFGSDEFPEYIGTNFIDGFGIYLNGVNIAFSNGAPLNINHPNSATPFAGTELDGVILNHITGLPVLQLYAAVVPGSVNNQLQFVLGDASDGIFDTTIYISGVAVPEPGSLGLMVLGLVAVIRRGRQRP